MRTTRRWLRSLDNLAWLLHARGRYAEAEALYKRALAIEEKAVGPNHPNVATTVNNLARLYRSQSRYGEAEQLHRRALTIREQALGAAHPERGIHAGRPCHPACKLRQHRRCIARIPGG